ADTRHEWPRPRGGARNQAVSAWRTSVTGRQAPTRAGMAARTATAISAATTATAIHAAAGTVTRPVWLAAANNAMPSGTPSIAPGTAGITCAAASPAVTCPGLAP